MKDLSIKQRLEIQNVKSLCFLVFLYFKNTRWQQCAVKKKK